MNNEPLTLESDYLQRLKTGKWRTWELPMVAKEIEHLTAKNKILADWCKDRAREIDRLLMALNEISNSKPHNFNHHVRCFQDIARTALAEIADEIRSEPPSTSEG